MLQSLFKAARLFQPSELRFGCWTCPICGNPFQIRLCVDEMGVRCMRCGASPVSQSIVDVIKSECPDLPALAVYELSSRGKVVDWLRAHVGSLMTSEYIPQVAFGEVFQGVRCEDVQGLTFEDASFDLCTCTEVFEHVSNDRAGFQQVRRVLRPGGKFIFTVPLSGAQLTIERVRVHDGQLIHVLEPEYHGDPFAHGERVLCVRNYGADILDRLREAGFSRASLVRPRSGMMRHARTVIVAER